VSVFGDEDMDTALPLCTDDGRFCLFSVRFSADGSEILGGANDGYIYLFDRERQTQSLRIHAHDDDVNAVSFVDTTTHVVASGGDDGFVKIWDRRALRESDPKPVGVLAGHVDGITFIDPKGDGRHLISNSKDQSIKLWDVRRFSSQSAVRATKAAVRNQNWDYRWQSVPPHLASAAGSAGNSRKRRSCGPASSGAASSRYLPSENDASIMTYRGHSVLQTLIRCHFSPAHTTGQRYIYTGCATGAVIGKSKTTTYSPEGLGNSRRHFYSSLRLLDWSGRSPTKRPQFLRQRRLLASV
jgi:WD repeat-containing protein 23